MSKKNYKAIQPKGQLDPTACWMASLSWWLKAARSISKSQVEILGMFGAVWASDGTIDSAKLIAGIQKHNAVFKMNIQEIFAGSLEYWVENSYPCLIGFQTPGGFGHINVIHNLDCASKMVEAMEPWFPDLPVINEPGEIPYIDGDKKFTGKHVSRHLSYYSSPLPGSSTVLIGIPQ